MYKIEHDYMNLHLLTYLYLRYQCLGLIKGVLLNMFVKNHSPLDPLMYNICINPLLLPVLLYNVVSFDCGVL